MISIVTPTLDQGRFLESALQSVLTQPVEVEYVVVDGGSEDGTREILERYESRLAAWRSEPDDGQYDALNKGFALTSGEIMGWLNADDFYVPGALSVVEQVFATHPQIDWLTSSIALIANEPGQIIRVLGVARFSREAFMRGFNLPRAAHHSGHFVPQESTFWRRSLWERAGGRLDASVGLAGDFDLWARFYEHAELWSVRALLGVYRMQPEQKTARLFAEYVREAEEVLRRRGGASYSGLESRVRASGLVDRASMQAWRLPRAVRRPLERANVLYRTPELVWDARAAAWTVGSLYFV
jgi:glycosyltransferase involved in cell wall biosynthesis